MYEDDLKYKYNNLKNKLYEISNELIDLNYSFKSINNSIENNISINDKNPVKHSMDEFYDTTNSINDCIRNRIIPRINNKL